MALCGVLPRFLRPGMTRLKGIATDQLVEIKVQEAMIDVIGGEMDTATTRLNQVNAKMKNTLKRAGGATSLLVKMCLVILILALCLYIYRMVA
jgi:t-SNARE complex subunit (syntaxin)